MLKFFSASPKLYFPWVSLGLDPFLHFGPKTHQDAHVYACVAAEVLFAPHTPIQGYSVVPFKVKIIIT